jgi:radical SAM protein with 4Fe4S-binding SPASM domain
LEQQKGEIAFFEKNTYNAVDSCGDDNNSMSEERVMHHRLGDLTDPNAVRMNGAPLIAHSAYRETDRLMFHLTVTGRCYARCEGCINSAITLGCDDPRNALEVFEETNPERDVDLIERLAERHPHKPITVCFYGGEPFLSLDKMVRVWELLRASANSARYCFLVYTNGELFIDAFKAYPEFMQDIWTYSVSIDGDQAQHNRIRVGTDLKKIIQNLEHLRTYYNGNVLFWSTLRENQSLLTCFEEFMRLYESGLVNHFFWHWAEDKEPFQELSAYAGKYAAELDRIMRVYAARLFCGELLPIAHINELVLYLLTGKERGHTACGVELAKNYDIVSGKVYPCADLPPEMSIGCTDLNGDAGLNERNLDTFVQYKEQLGCFRCGVHPYCGGRCPVQAIAGSPERTRQICQLMRLHVGIVQEYLNEIRESLKAHNITPQYIHGHSAFLAKYTDVVP